MCIQTKVLCSCGHCEDELMNQHCPCDLVVGEYLTSPQKCGECFWMEKKRKCSVQEAPDGEGKVGDEVEKEAEMKVENGLEKDI